MNKTPPSLDGLWKYNWDAQELDNKSAVAVGHLRKDGSPAPHGTYTPVQYFTVRTSAGADGSSHGVLDIFTDKGDFGRFCWHGDAWEAQTEEVIFKLTADHKNLDKDAEVRLRPSLVLRRYEAANCPSNAREGECFIESLKDPPAHAEEIKGQRIVPHGIEGTFSWKSNAHESVLTFTQCYQQERQRGEGADAFGDTFRGDTKMAQIAFPFYGFNPSNMNLYASGPQELTPTGPGTPRTGVVKTNPHQSFNGTLVFAFPTEDSMDYVRVEDLKDQPFLPLGLGGRPLDNKEERAHTEMVSSAKEQMQSWSVTLGLSGGIEKLMDIGGKGAYRSKLEEQTKTQCRYAVSRKVTKSWVIFADLPSHTLHDDFRKAVLSNTVDLLNAPASKPRWEDFVTSYGTHYAHAITQGSIEYAETRFSLQAETRAHSQGLDLKSESSVVLDGVKLGASSDYSQEWKKKHGIEISNEDVTSYSVGTDFPMGIFFDLRPLYELFSPVFFPYNPCDDDLKYAPFIWQTARKSFADFLEKRAADKPTDIDFSRNYTPHVFKVTFPSISLSGWRRTQLPMFEEHDTGWHGKISLAGYGDTGLVMNMNEVDIPVTQDLTFSPNAAKFFCEVVAKAGSAEPLRFYISVQSSVDRQSISSGFGRGVRPPPQHSTVPAVNATRHLVEVTLPQNSQGGTDTTNTTLKLTGDEYSLEISISAVDVGLLD